MKQAQSALRKLLVTVVLIAGASQVLANGSTRIPNFTSQTYRQVYAGQKPASYLPYWHGFHFWNRTVGAEVIPQLTFWTEHLYSEVSKAKNLTTVDAKGIRHLCPKYVSLDREKRILFWTRLISIMASYESSYNARTTFNEPSMRGVKSVGLLQLSTLSSSIGAYQCTMVVPPEVYRDRNLVYNDRYKKIIQQNLMDPKKNLSCGVRIMDHWIGRDKVMVDNIRDTDGTRYWRGLARFWGVFRHPKLKDSSTAQSFWDEIDNRRPRWQDQSRKRDSHTAQLLKEARRNQVPWGHFDWKLKRSSTPHPSLMEDYYGQFEQHRLTAIVRLANQTGFCF